MRIALVSQAYPPVQGGGIATQTHAKARGLAARGHEIHVLTHARGWPTAGATDGGVRLWPVAADPSGATEAEAWVQHSAAVAAKLRALQTQALFDVVEFAEYGAEGYVYLQSAPRGPVVIQLHGPLVMLAHAIGWPPVDSDFYRQGTRLEAACVQAADAVYSSSACSANWCRQHYGLKRAGVVTLHTGVDVNLFRPDRSAPSDRLTVMFVGKLVENKGVVELTRAARELAAEFPGLKLELVGPGDETMIRHLRQMTADVPGLLETPGQVTRADLPARLGRAQVFAAPSRYEGGPGFVYLEAMACGLPVIACAGSGASEVVRDGETGVLVPPGDGPALTDALRRLLHDPERRAQLGRQAREYVEAHADSRRCLDEIEAFYRRVGERRS